MSWSSCIVRMSFLLGLSAALPVLAQQGPPGGDRPELDLPPDPQEILETCLEHTGAAADRCVERIGSMTERCLAAIAEALDAGDTRKAVQLGRTCHRRIRGIAHRCVEHINRTCRRCARAMEENGATEDQLAALEEGCDAAKQSVRQAAMRASDAIKDALPDRPEPGAEDDGSGTDE